MRSFQFDEEMLHEKVGQATTKYNNMIDVYKQATLLLREAEEEINSHSELSQVDFRYFEGLVENMVDKSYEYSTFPDMVDHYRSTVDKQFSNETEAILERFSKIKVEDYSVANNLGLLASEYTKSDQIICKVGLKDNITFEDILSYGTVSTVMQTQFAEMKSLSKDKQKEYLEDLIKSGNVQYEDRTERWISLGLDVIPIVGDLKGIVECIVGQDLITGRELSSLERGLSLISVIPLIGDGSNFIRAGLKFGPRGFVKAFGKELLVNTTFMGAGIVSNELGVPPLAALGFY